jgi:diaminopimelate decarboxylase
MPPRWAVRCYNTIVIRYRHQKLFVEQVPVEEIARSVGTPVYVYSKKKLLDSYAAYKKAFRRIPHLICYALKANSNLSLLKLLAQAGSGADIVSGGELYRALKAGFPPERIVFAGVGKTAEEIETALRRGVFAVHVESEQELLLIDEIAGRIRKQARLSFRINPNIDPRTHPYISTGLKKHKFGIPIDRAFSLYRKAAKLSHVEVEGMHIHLGSQIHDVKPFEEAVRKSLTVIDRLSAAGIRLKHLDVGGGLGVDYENDAAGPVPQKLADVLIPLLKGRPLQLLLEPGRSIVAAAGILLSKVLYTKQNYGKNFVIVDAAMNDFIRPALYSAHHKIAPACLSNGIKSTVDIVGPVCETGDFFAKDRELEPCNPGDYLAIFHAGAYGFSMSSNYNTRPRPAEVLVDRDHYYVIRRRETYGDLVRGEL